MLSSLAHDTVAVSDPGLRDPDYGKVEVSCRVRHGWGAHERINEQHLLRPRLPSTVRRSKVFTERWTLVLQSRGSEAEQQGGAARHRLSV